MSTKNQYISALLSILSHRTFLLIICLQGYALTASSDVKLELRSKAFVVSPESLPTRISHAVTLTEVKPGLLMAAWYGGNQQGSGDVRIWGAHYENGQWQEPVQLTYNAPNHLPDPHWDPVLFNDDSLLRLHYKVGHSPREWQGFHISSSDDGQTWSSAKPEPEGFWGPIRNTPIKLSDNNVLYPSSTEFHGWQIHFELETNKKRLYIPVEDPHMLGAIQPALLTHPDGQLQALCRTHSGVIAETWSHDNGLNWSPLQTTQLPNPSSAISAITLRNGIHLLVYNPVPAGRTPLVIALSNDGKQWRQAMILEDTDGEYSYPSIIEGSDNTIHIAYTWQRRAIRHVQLKIKDRVMIE
ncbi:exo-alpha-sialidase [Kistimonas scapharcae]|uniref:Exo-alpha-sialidase n=1 Tax=Kistimonas scapharcae TaxID=1036133 RepID=A0ABP8V937_9GAMM